MYLVINDGNYIFFFDDPRSGGFDGEVIQGVELEGYDDDRATLFAQRRGTGFDVDQWLGVVDGTHYRVFDSRPECVQAGFQPLTIYFGVSFDPAALVKEAI
jgi:hypothetical protein